MTLIRPVHGAIVHRRRVRVLARHLSDFIPANASVLDVGSGDGWLASCVLSQRPDLQWTAVDTLARPQPHVPVQRFDGTRLPLDDSTFDIVLFVDVLHHTDDPMLMLREAVRVARQGIVVKDHLREGFLAGATLRFMDWVGNAGWGVALPYNYWNAVQWRHAREQLHIEIDKELTALGLYPWWANWWFGRSLHFIARFRVPFGEHGRFKPSATRVES